MPFAVKWAETPKKHCWLHFSLAASNSDVHVVAAFLAVRLGTVSRSFTLWTANHCRAKPARFAILIGMLVFGFFWTYNGYYVLCLMLVSVYCVFLAPNSGAGCCVSQVWHLALLRFSCRCICLTWLHSILTSLQN